MDELRLSKFENIFHDLFLKTENTILVNGLANGYSEPIYLPAHNGSPAQIVYANGFVTSALHEVAHWCHAGFERRQQVDYGYWYAGDERTQLEQAKFEQVELVPQAYEYLLSQAVGLNFSPSLDNFNVEITLDRELFFEKIKYTAKAKYITGLSPRLNLLLNELHYD